MSSCVPINQQPKWINARLSMFLTFHFVNRFSESLVVHWFIGSLVVEEGSKLLWEQPPWFTRLPSSHQGSKQTPYTKSYNFIWLLQLNADSLMMSVSNCHGKVCYIFSRSCVLQIQNLQIENQNTSRKRNSNDIWTNGINQLNQTFIFLIFSTFV